MEAKIPPLRERREDIPLLVERLLASRTPPCALSDLPPNTLEMLMAHAWPGNVRELRNSLSRILLFQTADVLGSLSVTTNPGAPAPATATASLPFHEAREALVAEFERRYVAEKLQAAGGNISSAARAMGVSRQFLHKLITEHGLKGISSGSS